MTWSIPPRLARSSRMYDITGLPATLIIGLGVTCVWGRSRVPLPASGMMTFTACSRRAGPFASVLVAQTDHIIQVRRRRLQHVAIRDRDHLVHRPRRIVIRLTDCEPHVPQRPIDLDEIPHFAGEKMDGFFLDVVILKGQLVPGLDMQDLAHVLPAVRPDRLMAPRLGDDAHRVVPVTP